MSTPSAPTIRFGSWLRLYSLQTIMSQLKQFGLTERSLTILLHNLRVPIIHIGRHKLVDSFTFFLAMRAVLSLGCDDFYVPGSKPCLDSRAHASKLPSTFTKRDERRLIGELLYAKRFNGITLSDAEIRSAATTALERFQHASLRLAISKAIEDRAKKSYEAKQTVRKGQVLTILDPLPTSLEGEFKKSKIHKDSFPTELDSALTTPPPDSETITDPDEAAFFQDPTP